MSNITILDIITFLESIGVDYDYNGDINAEVKGFSTPQNYRLDTLTWAKTQQAADVLNSLNTTMIIAQRGLKLSGPNVLYTEQSRYAFFSVLENFWGSKVKRPAVGVNTYISPQVVLGENVTIGNGCTIDGDVIIGNNTSIGNNVVIINKVNIGSKCVICSGVVIGHDGFGYIEDSAGHRTMITHYGGVVIGSDVQIGVNSVICRGTIDDTVIGSGTKIDNLCTVSHNDIIGENGVLITGTLLHGSVKLGKNVYLAGATVKNQCSVGDNTFVGMGTVIIKDVPPGCMAVGTPQTKVFGNK